MGYSIVRSLVGSWILPLGLAISILASNSAMAQVTDATIKLNVGPEGYPPYTIADANDVQGGIVWDVLLRIAEKLHYTVSPYRIPRKRVDNMLLDGAIDATPRAVEWTVNPSRFIFTDPIVSIREVVFSRSEDGIGYRQPADLEGKTVVTYLGFNYPAVESLFESGKAQRFDVPQDMNMFRYLFYGEQFDFAIADVLAAQWLINKRGWHGKFKHSDSALSETSLRLMVRPQMLSFVDDFNHELEQMRRSGELAQIIDSYR